MPGQHHLKSNKPEAMGGHCKAGKAHLPRPSHLPEEGNPSKQEESKSGSDDGSPEEKDNSEGGHQTSSEGQSSQSVPKGAIFRGRWHYKQESKP